MDLKILACLCFFCCLSWAAATDTVRPPTEELQITCKGCNADMAQTADSMRFYAFMGSEVRLTGRVPGGGDGEWTDIAGNPITKNDWIAFFAYSDADFVFRGGGQNKTAHVIALKRELCRPEFESKIEIVGDDEDLKWFSVGKTFEAKIEVSNVDCDYGLVWITDDPETLEIKKPGLARTEVRVKRVPENGKNPTLKVSLSNALGTIDTEEKEIVVEEAAMPELELSVTVKTGRSSSDIIVSSKGSLVPNEDGRLEEFYAKLSYFDGTGFVDLAEKKSGGGNITFRASRGEGGYQVTAWIEDEYGGRSKEVTNTVKVESAPEEIPNVYVKSSYVYCYAGVACTIDAPETSRRNGNAMVAFYDKAGNKFSCSGDICQVVYRERGEYKVYVRAYYFGEEDRGYKNKEVTVLVV